MLGKAVEIEDDEKWHGVINSPAFEVSSYGRIRVSGSREIKQPTLAKSGYLVVNLYQYRRSDVRNVHSLVAEAFISPRPKGHMVVHLDGHRRNNRWDNLSYVSLGQRRPRQASDGLVSHPLPKLSEDQSTEIRRRAKLGGSTSVLAQEFGVSAPLVSGIKHNRKWREIDEEVSPADPFAAFKICSIHSQLGCNKTSELFWLSDAQWERIKPLITTMPLRKRRNDDRQAVSGIIHVLNSASSWGRCPMIYGSNKTLYKRYVSWAKLGLWERIFIALAGAEGSQDRLLVDYAAILTQRQSKSES